MPPGPSLLDKFRAAIMGSGALQQAAQTGGPPPAPPPSGPQDPTQLQDAVKMYMMNLEKQKAADAAKMPATKPPKALGEAPKKKKSPRTSATRAPKAEDY